VAEHLINTHAMPIKRACHMTKLSRTAWYRQACDTCRDTDVISALNGLMERWPRWGFWKCFHWLKGQGHAWNYKRVWRVYCIMKLNLPRRKKRTVLTRERQPLVVLPLVNQSGSLDFMQDALLFG
jgi:putative transposase